LDSPASTLPPLATAGEMREWERLCFTGGGLSERVVMESAGRAAAWIIARECPEGRVVAAVGPGNNGGDAAVALRTLRAWGREVAAFPAGEAELPTALLHGWEIPFVRDAREAIRGAGVLVDGILGTGASGPPRLPQAEAIRSLNASGLPIVALDGPTGVDMTTGEVAGEAIHARITVTFGTLKRGLLLFPGRDRAGRVVLAEVGFPPLEHPWAARFVTDAWALAELPRIPRDAHKGRAGVVAVVAGREGMGGAAILAAMGALRSGCGGVRVVSDSSNRIPVHAAVPEAVFFDRSGTELPVALEGVGSLLIGPGMGTGEEARSLLTRLLTSFAGSVLLDADALTLLAADPDILSSRSRRGVLLTPHPGELARLLHVPREEVLADRFAAAEEAARRFGCAVLAKGSPSLVAEAGEPTLLSATGHSGLATGGMGDTLGGIAAALLAAGVSPRVAGGLALQIGGRAAELAGRGRSLLPRDVAESLPAAIASLERPSPTVPGFPLEIPPPA